MSTYFPYPFFHDDVPIDISFIFEDEKPAGKHGFLKVQGRDFVFEDGTKVKFWGTNFNGAGCFPEHEYAEKLARRLAKTGINLVRFHQLDSEWHTPNIFNFVKGKRVTDGHLDPESMERLDYLIYCLKQEGIYVYLDMITYRRFRSDEGVENAHILRDAGKPYSIYSKRLIELQKEFCEEIWSHYNPYTETKYCDEPAIVLTEITNECDLFGKFKLEDYQEPYKAEFLTYLDAWLIEQRIDRKAEDFDVMDDEDEELLKFKVYLQKKYYVEMMECMHKAGVKIPIAGTNWAVVPSNHETQIVCDFLDTHSYFYDWNWKEFEKKCSNEGISQRRSSYLAKQVYQSDANMPTYISEWDMPWPNERRAGSVLYSAAVGAFQGWSGFAIHTYSYSTKLDKMDMLGYEVTAPKIGNVPYRQGVFATWNDPAKFGLFYHAALITRRGDISEGKVLYGVDSKGQFKWDKEKTATSIERYKIVSSFEMKDGLPELPEDTGESFAESDTKELYRNWEKEIGIIDSPRTKCVYGSLCHNGKQELQGVSVDCTNDYAVVAMSSLTDKAITESDNILLTTVGRAVNTDAKFEGELMLDIGKGPVLVENITADITIETPYEDMEVWSLSAEGYYIGKLPTVYENGKLKFKVGKISRTMYYLIVRA